MPKIQYLSKAGDWDWAPNGVVVCFCCSDIALPLHHIEKDDFLTPLQIAGFSSPLTGKKTYIASSVDIERHEANKEKDIQELTEEVMET